MIKHIDQRWYGQLLAIISPIGETFTLLEPSSEILKVQKAEFEASDYQAPVTLFPDRSIMIPLEEPFKKLLDLRAHIEAEEKDTLVQEQYFAFIDDMKLNIRLIEAACQEDNEAYRLLNDELYGRPSTALYSAVCAWMRRDTRLALEKEQNQAVQAAAEEVLKLIPETNGDIKLITPDADTFRQVRDLHFQAGGFFDTLFGNSGLPNAPYIGQTEGDIICRRILDNIGAEDYKVTDSKNNIWSVSRDPKELHRPTNYRLTRDDFIGIIAHEIGSHIYESVNGNRQPLNLLETGLAGYVHGNEGRALLREQIIHGTITTSYDQSAWEYCIMKHLAISLALGYNNEHEYSLPEIFNLLYRLYHFWLLRRYPTQGNIETRAREEAWLLTVRLLKGTDGKGGCYQKDYVYLEGNAKTWELAKTDPGLVLLGDQGKFNLLDPRHRSLVSDFLKSSKKNLVY